MPLANFVTVYIVLRLTNPATWLRRSPLSTNIHLRTETMFTILFEIRLLTINITVTPTSKIYPFYINRNRNMNFSRRKNRLTPTSSSPEIIILWSERKFIQSIGFRETEPLESFYLKGINYNISSSVPKRGKYLQFVFVFATKIQINILLKQTNLKLIPTKGMNGNFTWGFPYAVSNA